MMRVLWITNIIFPAPCKELGLPSPVYGGWMLSSLEAIRKLHPEVEFAVATVYRAKEMKTIYADGVTYYLLPARIDNTRYDKSLEAYWMKVNETFRPDVVHIHGTEYAHGLAFIRACGADNICVSIQGLVSVYYRYYYAGISSWDILKNITVRDVIRWDTIFQQKRKFENRGELEKEYLKTVPHIIGRTSWDKAHLWAINPDAEYHFCNETLRPVFYQRKWEYDKCDKHTIFLSQAGYPIKGLHKVLEAMPLVLRHFPDARLRVAGQSIVDKPFYRMSGYGKYIRLLINKLGLNDKITFLGTLSEEEMCEQYLRANVFICPSSIENSPNSLGEAQIMGVPHLAASVGGVPDMMKGNEECLYRFEEVEMLAEKICDVFSMSIYDEEQQIKTAHIRHSEAINSQTLFDAYNVIRKDIV